MGALIEFIERPFLWLIDKLLNFIGKIYDRLGGIDNEK